MITFLRSQCRLEDEPNNKVLHVHTWPGHAMLSTRQVEATYCLSCRDGQQVDFLASDISWRKTMLFYHRLNQNKNSIGVGDRL